MWKIAILAASGALLASCASTYDESALASAGAAMALAKDQCAARRASGELPTNLAGVECNLAADKAFAQAIKLRKMDLYDAYAGRMRLMASERDAGTITRDVAVARSNAIWRDYILSIDAAEKYDEQQRARVAAGFAAAGASMQAASAQIQADQAAYAASHPQMNCTSTKFGFQVHTVCN